MPQSHDHDHTQTGNKCRWNKEVHHKCRQSLAVDVELRLVCGLIDHERFFDAPKDLCRELGTLKQTLVQRKKTQKKEREKERKYT